MKPINQWSTRAQKVRRLFFASWLAMAAIAAMAMPSRAEISFSISPALNDLAAKSGASGTQAITLSNNGSNALDITAGVEVVPSASPERSAVGWLSIEESTWHLEPGDRLEMPVLVQVPKGVLSGGYYAQLTFTTGSGDASANSAAIAGQLSAGFLITVDGDGKIVRQAAIARLAPMLDGDGRVSFQMVVESAGNVHIIPANAAVEVRNADGSALGSLDFDLVPPILPGNSATLVTRGSLPLTLDGSFQAVGTFTFGDETITSTVDFDVSPELAVNSVTVCENLDRGPTFAVELSNSGDLALSPMVTMSLAAEDGTSLGQAAVPFSTPLWPKSDADQAIDYPDRLVSGRYLLVTEIAFDPHQPPIRQETPFQIGGLDGDPAPLCSELSATPTS